MASAAAEFAARQLQLNDDAIRLVDERVAVAQIALVDAKELLEHA